MTAPRRLAELTAGWPELTVEGAADTPISLLTTDSRHVTPGALFVAIRGVGWDGHAFLPEALARGAAAIAGDDPEAVRRLRGPAALVKITVPDTRAWIGRLAARWWGEPSHRLGLIGVTGTNGKTTTTHLIRAILDAAGRRTGLLGTIGYALGDEVRPADHTTPDPLSLQALLADMVAGGLTDAVMEVSSHALAQDRTAGCAFDVAVFTNLTQDHLDFHGTMEAYAAAKRRLFEHLGDANPKSRPQMAIINRDDPYWESMAAASRVPVWTYGLTPSADIYPEGVTSTVAGLGFEAVTPRGRFDLTSPLAGSYNLSNILAAVAVALSQDVPLDAVRAGVASMSRVPGRFEKVEAGQDFTVVVDYAHTEDALRRVLLVAKDLCRGRLITVFGCGGDRDPGKRAPMGRAAIGLSDLVIVTSDNPRREDPLAIIAAIETGLRDGLAARTPARASAFSSQPYLILPDRRDAIERAIHTAEPGDVVLIAGKGHEDYQILGTQRVPFDDRRVAVEAIARRFAPRVRSA
ncbi:MAG: UDP-N-acetylmuramoyl-L-alanyl-D-glutamate--2,6-diaminopimelate ligase [Nitrospiria bacterium]